MKPTRAVTEALLLFLAFFLPGFVAQAAMSSTGAVTTLGLLQSVVAGIPQCLLMAYIAGARGPWSSPRWGLVPFGPRDGLVTALLVLACFGLVFSFFALVTSLPPQWTKGFVSGYRWGLQRPSQLPVALLFSLAAGYREEFYFRAYLLERMEEIGVRNAAAIAVSTSLFCVGHVYEGPLGIVVAAVLGTVFALAYKKRKNLHIIAIAHGLYNTLVLSLSLVTSSSLPVRAGFRIFFP
jgi:uncharacterized protein